MLAQIGKGRGHAFAGSENGRAGHQDIGARFNCQPCGFRIDTAIHLQVTCGLDPFDHLADAPDLWQGRLEKLLMSETRVDRHDQYLIDVGQDLFQHSPRRSRVDRHAGALTQTLDAVNGAMQVSVAFPMNEKRVGACLDKLIEEKVRRRDHQVRFEGKPRYSPERMDNRRSHREVGNEVAIHDIDVNPIGAGPLRLGHLLSQMAEICRKEDRKSVV